MRFLLSSIAAATSLATLVHAYGGAPGYNNSRLGPSNAVCSRKKYSVSVDSENFIFTNVDNNANQTYIQHIFQQYVSSLPYSSNFTTEFTNATSKANLSTTYNISGTICYPKNTSLVNSSSAIQILVHGIAFDSSYWDFVVTNSTTEEYSYVRAAAEAGLATFRYDRLGTGASDHPVDTYKEVQASTEVAILAQLVEKLKGGAIDGVAYKKVISVGHSFGSVQTQAVTNTLPSLIDGAVLTGFTLNATWVGYYVTSGVTSATKVFPGRWKASELPSTYLVSQSDISNQINFLLFPYYAEEVFLTARNSEQPVTQADVITLGSVLGPAPAYKDWIFCGGDCYAIPEGINATSMLDLVVNVYPNASSFETWVPANTGHAINQHYSAGESYAKIIGWILEKFY